MRKVKLTMLEQRQYEIIKKLVDNGGNKKRAALQLGCTVRTINRKCVAYKNDGKVAFSHKNKMKKPHHALSHEQKQQIINFRENKYYDANFKHFQELLQRNENISISYTALYNIMKEHDILSPKARKITRKMYKQKMKAKKKEKVNKNTNNTLAFEDTSYITPLEFAHPRQERCKYFGESVQMDASQHMWFGGKKAHLHLVIDNASAMILGAFFDEQETLKAYYTITKQMIETYGIPAQIITDNRTVFNYEKKGETRTESSSTTQYGYACKTLGIDLKTTSVPQAKGQVERSFGTHQSRLLVELRLAGCNSIEEANLFLPSYVQQHNKNFALPLHSISSVFEKLPKHLDINHILAVLSTRTVDSGHCIRFNNKTYATYDNDLLINLRPKTQVLVVQTFDGELYSMAYNQTYKLNEVLMHKEHSLEFDPPLPKKHIKSKSLKPMENHPWKSDDFYKYLQDEKIDFNKYIYSNANAYV